MKIVHDVQFTIMFYQWSIFVRKSMSPLYSAIFVLYAFWTAYKTHTFLKTSTQKRCKYSEYVICIKYNFYKNQQRYYSMTNDKMTVGDSHIDVWMWKRLHLASVKCGTKRLRLEIGAFCSTASKYIHHKCAKRKPQILLLTSNFTCLSASNSPISKTNNIRLSIVGVRCRKKYTYIGMCLMNNWLTGKDSISMF